MFNPRRIIFWFSILATAILLVQFFPLGLDSEVRRKEILLREELYMLRGAIRSYHDEHHSYPPSLDSLVSASYLRNMPTDPFTQSSRTWQVVIAQDGYGIQDVHSGSLSTDRDGVPYAQW